MEGKGKIIQMYPNGSPEIQSVTQDEYDIFLARYKEFLQNKTITLREFNQRVALLDKSFLKKIKNELILQNSYFLLI